MTASATPQENFIEKAWDFIKAEFTHAEDLTKKIATFADHVTNVLRTNPTAQFIESGLVTAAEAIDPALTPMISGIELELPKILNLLSGAGAEVGKPLADQLTDFAAKLETIKGVNGTVYAGLVGTLNAAIQNYIISNSGNASIQANAGKLIATAQVAHASLVA